MRARALIAALLMVANVADPRDARIVRLEQWMKAAARHAPGESDEAAALVGGWSDDELRVLWMDASVLIALMHRTGLSRFTVKGEVMSDAAHVRYTDVQLQRLRALACAATGRATWASLFQ